MNSCAIGPVEYTNYSHRSRAFGASPGSSVTRWCVLARQPLGDLSFLLQSSDALGGQPPYHSTAARRRIVATGALVAIAAVRYSRPGAVRQAGRSRSARPPHTVSSWRVPG